MSSNKQQKLLRSVLKGYLSDAMNHYRFDNIVQERGLQEELEVSVCLDLVIDSLSIEMVQDILGHFYE